MLSKTMAAAAFFAAITAATPAFANDTLVAGDPCGVGFVTVGGQSALACVGYYGSNLLTGSAGQATSTNIKADLYTLLNNTAPGVQGQTAGYNPPYAADVNTILASVSNLNGANSFSFGTTLTGLTVIGAHFGNNIDSDTNNVTAFWLFDLTGNNSTVNFANGQGSSNAQLFSSGAVPEPATWAMMLIGFAGIGAAMRRGRKATALPQIA